MYLSIVCVCVCFFNGMQEVVDGMSLAGCSNLNAWVRGLDKKVEGVLAERLEKVIINRKRLLCVSGCSLMLWTGMEYPIYEMLLFLGLGGAFDSIQLSLLIVCRT